MNMTSELLAHYDKDKGLKQLLDEHLFNVARLARQEAAVIEQGDVLFLLGLYHDLGKADRLFQDKLLNNPNRHVDHSYAGAKYLYHRIAAFLKTRPVDKTERLFFNDIVGYVISAHHGMYDIPYKDDQLVFFQHNRFRYRICKEMPDYHYEEDIVPYVELLEQRLSDYGYRNLDDLIEKAFSNYHQALVRLDWKDKSEEHYYQACLVRLYLSLLKNTDIIDTINAYELMLEPMTPEDRTALNQSYLAAIEKKYASFGQPTTRLNEIRTQIANRVKERGQQDSTGIYRLDLPTGAGKTNLSMRYACHQLIEQGKSRFFYITPFLSVLEQNAAEIKKVLGQEGVLEHHSNVIAQQDVDEDEFIDLQAAYLMDSWDSQVVLTSMVQFFQTLFKTKSANIRRFASLINGVLILDEVQSLPIEVTSLFNLTMNFLSRVMNTTVVLCTATQPPYDSTEVSHRLVYAGKNGENADIIALTLEEKAVFSRTELRKYDDNNQTTSLSALVGFVLEKEESLLAIFNTKKTVDHFYNLLSEITDRPLYQLSTNMCAKHRLDIIADIKEQLQAGVPIICISTQLIEAGVDVDFHRVIRSYAGIDSIVQAAGRCNREGKLEQGQVTLVNLANDEENISRLKEIKAKKDATEYILHKITSPIEPSVLNDDFFNRYYANNQNLMDYPLSTDESVYDYLSVNAFAGSASKGKLKQSFKKAGDKMDLISSESIGVLVPYREARAKLSELESLCESDFPSVETYCRIKSLLRELQPYTVNLREHDDLLGATKVYLSGQVRILSEGYYNDEKGVIRESNSFLF